MALRERIGEIASVDRVDLISLSLREATVRLVFFGDEGQLALALAQRDMELKQGSVDWRLRMLAGDAKSATGPAASP